MVVNQIVTRMDKKRGALSTGYGFVEFASPSHVMEALKKMQGMELDGHVLELKFSKGLCSLSSSEAMFKLSTVLQKLSGLPKRC